MRSVTAGLFERGIGKRKQQGVVVRNTHPGDSALSMPTYSEYGRIFVRTESSFVVSELS